MGSANNSVWSFADPVNEVSARLVAGGGVVLSTLTIVLEQSGPPKRFAQGIARLRA